MTLIDKEGNDIKVKNATVHNGPTFSVTGSIKINGRICPLYVSVYGSARREYFEYDEKWYSTLVGFMRGEFQTRRIR